MTLSNLIGRFLNWLERRRRKRHWTPEAQLERLRLLIQTDHDWMAHNEVAKELTERYLAALRPDWYRISFTSTQDLRAGLGLDPNQPPRPDRQVRRSTLWREDSTPEEL